MRIDAACPPGSVRAVVGGKRVCLKPGQRCSRQYESTYRRYGFSCRAGKLVRRKPPKPPPPPGASVQATIALGRSWTRSGSRPLKTQFGCAARAGSFASIPRRTASSRVATPPIGFGYVAVGEGAVWQTSFGAIRCFESTPRRTKSSPTSHWERTRLRRRRSDAWCRLGRAPSPGDGCPYRPGDERGRLEDPGRTRWKKRSAEARGGRYGCLGGRSQPSALSSTSIRRRMPWSEGSRLAAFPSSMARRLGRGCSQRRSD